MKKESITGKNGYPIPCLHTLTGNEEKVVLIAHGFGSSKESPTAQMLAENLPKQGMGTMAFDFPAHGDSPADGKELTLEHCLDDLAAVEQHAGKLCPGAEIHYFGSSFGAYITLLYLSLRPHEGEKAFLRSTAVEMPALVRPKAPEEKCALERDGFIMADRDYLRPLKLTKEFFYQLDAHELMEIYRSGAAKLAMVHGSDDETASAEAALRFAKMSGADLTMIPGGDHRLSKPGMPEKVLELAEAFFGLKDGSDQA